MEQRREEYYERNVGAALERLGQLMPGQSILFVGLRDLAEELVVMAEKQGLKILADLKDGFNEHLLTLAQKKEEPNILAPHDQPIAKWRSWLRLGIVGIFSVFR